MPIQAPQWTEYLNCPVCENAFDTKARLPISLGCGHSICNACLSSLQRAICPFDQGEIHFSLTDLPVNTALVLIIDSNANLDQFRSKSQQQNKHFSAAMASMEKLATFLKPSRLQISRPMQRKLVTLINCQLLEEEGRARANRSARSLGERSVTELILQHQNPQQLSANLWAAVRSRGCQFLGPAMQEEVLKLVLLALEDGSAFSRKVLVMFVVQRLEVDFPQASKTSIGHVVQLLYRASCFKVTKRDGDSSLMQLKEEFRTYDTLRREHDAQIVQIATEAGLRIAPDQWSSLLYGDSTHKSHMQSIIDKLQTPQSFVQSVQELVIALQRTGDPGNLGNMRPDLDFLASLDPSPESDCADWETLEKALSSVFKIVTGLLAFIDRHQPSSRKHQDSTTETSNSSQGLNPANGSGNRYKTSMCRDLSSHGSCPRGRNCTFAHSQMEIEQYRRSNSRGKFVPKPSTNNNGTNGVNTIFAPRKERNPTMSLENVAASITPVAQVAPLPRGFEQPQVPVLPPGFMLPPEAVNHQLQQPEMDVFQHQTEMAIPVMGPMLPGPPPPPTPSPYHVENQSIMDGQTGMPMVIQPLVIEEHDSNMQRFPVCSEVLMNNEFTTPIQLPTGIIATKSLSALKSRKEEIMGHLEEMLGKREASKIQNQACNPPPMPPSTTVVNAVMPANQIGTENYSIWTSKALSDFAERNRRREQDIHYPGTTMSGGQQQQQGPKHGEGGERNSEVIMFENRMGGRMFTSDDVIPFTETPQISRFGPISRKGCSLMPSASPSQSQALINDEPTPTAVVRHSKQMARQVPTLAALYHQNGSCTTLQPVAVGVNGEIGYIAIPQENQMGPPGLFQVQQFPMNPNTNSNPPSAHLLAESERMKHELSILQRKISDLNLAHIDSTNHQPRTVVSSSSAPLSNQGIKESCGNSAVEGNEKNVLTRELHVIQSTIQDREKEIETNKMRFTKGVNDAGDALTFSKAMVHHDGSGGKSISTTATSTYRTIQAGAIH